MLPGTSKGLFLHDFFAKILPKERSLFAPTRQALAWDRLTVNLGLLAWVAIGIAICGMLSFSFVKNLGIMRGFPSEFTRPIVLKGDMGADLDTMNRYKSAVLKVHDKNESWWIPRLGLSQSRDAEARLKRNYCTLFDERFLALYDRQLTVDIKGIAPADQRIGEYIVYLVHRINLLKARLNGEDLSALHVAAHGGAEFCRPERRRCQDLHAALLVPAPVGRQCGEPEKGERIPGRPSRRGHRQGAEFNSGLRCGSIPVPRRRQSRSRASGGAVSMRPRTSGWNLHSR